MAKRKNTPLAVKRRFNKRVKLYKETSKAFEKKKMDKAIENFNKIGEAVAKTTKPAQRSPEGIEKEKQRKRDRDRSASSAVGQTKGTKRKVGRIKKRGPAPKGSGNARGKTEAAKRAAGGGQAKAAQKPDSASQKKAAVKRAAKKTSESSTGKQKNVTSKPRKKNPVKKKSS